MAQSNSIINSENSSKWNSTGLTDNEEGFKKRIKANPIKEQHAFSFPIFVFQKHSLPSSFFTPTHRHPQKFAV